MKWFKDNMKPKTETVPVKEDKGIYVSERLVEKLDRTFDFHYGASLTRTDMERGSLGRVICANDTAENLVKITQGLGLSSRRHWVESMRLSSEVNDHKKEIEKLKREVQTLKSANLRITRRNR